MGSKKKFTNQGNEQVLDTFIAAVKAHVPANAVIHIDGVAYSQPDLVKKAEQEEATLKSSRAAKEAFNKATADLRAAKADIRRFFKAAEIGMTAYLGSGNPDI